MAFHVAILILERDRLKLFNYWTYFNKLQNEVIKKMQEMAFTVPGSCRDGRGWVARACSEHSFVKYKGIAGLGNQLPQRNILVVVAKIKR